MDKISHPRKKQWVLGLSILLNLLFLGYFKYVNFFVENFIGLLRKIGFEADFVTVQVLLPIGISFYTFHNISYLVDVYRKQIPVCKNIVIYFSFMSYFPQLVAGPIQRAKDLIPQFQKKRAFDYTMAVDGLRQALWGFFKKMVIADTCSVYVNRVFENYATASGAELVLGVLYFSFQIYGDFSGYTDIALGVSKLFGIELTTNFKTPYFAHTIPEFWKRWHISLTSWFKDYVYIPLGGSKGGLFLTLRNTFIIFLISGLWHGANRTFLVWGLLNAFLFLPSIVLKKDTTQVGFNLSYIAKTFLTFLLISFTWIFFRADSLGTAINYIRRMVGAKFFPNAAEDVGYYIAILLVVFTLVEWKIFRNDNSLRFLAPLGKAKWALYIAICLAILMSIKIGNETSFIYFQF
jgi:D-alanyl-lipoteichoic acid acyltransferase DltB (MBOAT superfamily)